MQSFRPLIADPQDADAEKRKNTLLLCTLATVHVGMNFCVISTLLFGIVKRRTLFFFPYFTFASIMISTAICAVFYLLFSPGQRFYAFMAFMFAFAESKFVYATLSYYKLLTDNNQVKCTSSYAIECGGPGK